jgi:hypothetical protein
MKITSDIIKASLYSYFRFRRQYIVAEEVETEYGCRADILADNGKEVIEVEIKTSKSDLKNEIKKRKFKTDSHNINKFYYCLPKSIIDDSVIAWITSLNKKFGIIEFDDDAFSKMRYPKRQIRKIDSYLHIIKNGLKLTDEYEKVYRDLIMMRLSSFVSNHYQQIALNELLKIKKAT